MCARFTVLNETPIAAAIAGWVMPLSRSNTIWMRSRCDAGSFHRSAVFSCRTWLLVHLTICSPESDDHRIIPSRLTGSSGLPQISDSISYGSGISEFRLKLEVPEIFAKLGGTNRHQAIDAL